MLTNEIIPSNMPKRSVAHLPLSILNQSHKKKIHYGTTRNCLARSTDTRTKKYHINSSCCTITHTSRNLFRQNIAVCVVDRNAINEPHSMLAHHTAYSYDVDYHSFIRVIVWIYVLYI